MATHFLTQNYSAHKVKKIRKMNIVFYFCIKQKWCVVIDKKRNSLKIGDIKNNNIFKDRQGVSAHVWVRL